MSVESSPAIIKYNDGVKVFSSAGGVRKCCCELRSCEALMSQSTWQSEGVWWMRTKYRSMCLKKNMLFLKSRVIILHIYTHKSFKKYSTYHNKYRNTVYGKALYIQKVQNKYTFTPNGLYSNKGLWLHSCHIY